MTGATINSVFRKEPPRPRRVRSGQVMTARAWNALVATVLAEKERRA